MIMNQFLPQAIYPTIADEPDFDLIFWMQWAPALGTKAD